MAKRVKNRAFLKDVAVGVICVFIYSFVFFSVKSPAVTAAIGSMFSFQDVPAGRLVSTLAPTLRIKPMVDIEKRGEGYVIVEKDPSESAPVTVDLENVKDPDKRANLEDRFQDDVAFMYMCHLIARSLELGISEQGLKDLIEKHLPHVDFTRFLWQKIYKSGKMFCLPYIRKDMGGDSSDNEVHILKFYLDDGSSAVTFPDKVLLTINNVKVILEDPIVPLSSIGSRASEEDVADAGIPSMLSSFANPSGTLPVDVNIKSVTRKGSVMFPDRKKEEYMLNAGVLSLDGKRLLFARRATEVVVPGEKKGDSGIRRSEIGLFVHDVENNKVIEIERAMLVPDGEDIVALEDARVIERNGTIYVYMTAVEKDGSYYSVVVTHPTDSFTAELKKKIEAPDEAARWDWSAPKKLITTGKYSRQNNKNFVPFGNPVTYDGKTYWCALYRPEEDDRSSIRMALSEEGLLGTWRDAGTYMKMNPVEGWLGASAYVAEMPIAPGRMTYDFMLYHKAGYRDAQKTSKYYDIRLIVSDRNNPLNYYATEPILVPEEGFELRGWVPGAIYSCGAILTEYDVAKGEYTFDVYYSGSDTAVLLATVTIELKDKDTARIREEMIRQARDEFNQVHELYGQLERTRETAHRRGDGYYGSGYAYNGLRQDAEKLRDRLEAWRVKWAKGFGVDKEVRGMVRALDDMSEIIKGASRRGSAGDVYYQLNGPFNAFSVYLLNAYSEVNNTSLSVDTEKFVTAPLYKVPVNVRGEFEELYADFQKIQRIRDGFSRLEGDSIYNYRTVWNTNVSYALGLGREAAKLREKMEVWNVMRGKQVGVHGTVSSIIQSLADIEKMCRARDLYSHGTVNLRELYYMLNTPMNSASVSFMAARHHDGWLSTEKELGEKNAEVMAASKKQDLKAKTSEAITLIDTLRLRAFEAKGRDQKIIIGFDTSWIPGLDSEQGMAIQSLLSEIYRLTKTDGLENIIVLRGKGASLASTIMKRAEETGTPLSNVVVLGSETTVQSDEFAGLRSTDTEQRAFLAGVNPKNLTENSYIRVLEMLTLAVKLAFGEIDSVPDPKISASKLGPRLWIFIPEAEPFDFKELKQIYDNQLQALVAA